MTATFAQPKTLTFLEFLEKEQKSDVKYEFHKGKLKEMAGERLHREKNARWFRCYQDLAATPP